MSVEAGYSAGTVFLDIVPSFKRFGEADYYRDAQAAGRSLGEKSGEGFDEGFEKAAGRALPQTLDKVLGDSVEKSSEEAGKDAGRKFTGAFQRALRDNIKSATSTIGKGVDDELDEIRKAFKALGKLKIGTDIGAKEAVAEFTALIAQLKAMVDNADLDLETRFNAHETMRNGTKLISAVQALFAKPIEMKVELDAQNTLKGMFRMRAMAEKIMAKPIDLLVRANGDLKGMYRFRAMAEQIFAKPVEVELETSKERAERELEQIQLEYRRLRAEITLGLDDAAVKAAMTVLERRVRQLDSERHGIDFHTNALEMVAQIRALNRETDRSRAAGLDAANSFRSFSGVVLGVATLGPLVVPALAAITGGVLALGTAAAGVGAGLGVGILGLSGIGTAVGALADVQKNAEKDAASYARTLRTASNGVRDAEISLQRARESAAESNEQAARQVADAIEGQRRAEEDLRDAQEDARRTQERLTDARERAQEQLEDMALRARGGALAERQAVLDLAEATRDWESVSTNPAATDEDRERFNIALERERLNLEQIRVENARLAEEREEANRAGIDGMDVVVQAQDAVTAANDRVEGAQRAVQEAAEQVTQAQVQQARMARDGARSIEDATRRLTDAQIAHGDALYRTGDLGSESMQKLEEAMGKLSPAGQAFAAFIFGLRDEFYGLRAAAQEGMLPGLQSGLELLMSTYGPGLLTFVSDMSKVLGTLFERMSVALTSPVWVDFFSMMAQYAPIFTEQFALIMGNIGTALAGLMTAMAPFAKDFGDALVQLTGAWASWAASLGENQAFQDFLGYLSEIGPQVWEFIVALAGALLNLAIALAPYAGALLDAFTGILDFIAGMDPDLLGAVVVAIIAITVAFQALVGIVSLLTGAGIAFAAFGGLFAILTGAASAATLTATGIAAVAGAIVAAVILIGAAIFLLWNHVDWFREGVTALWDGFRGSAEATANFLTETVWPAIQSVWDGIAAGATWLWENILSPVWDRMQRGFAFVGEVLSGIWNNVIKPVFDVFALVVQLLWEMWLGPIFGFIGDMFSAVGATIAWVWNSVLGPVFELFGAVMKLLWNTVLSPIFDWIMEKWDVLALAMEFAYNKYIKPPLEAFADLIETHVKPIFERAIEAIKAAWGSLTDALKTPVRFIVDTIINKGLVDNFNVLARAFGTSEIKPLELPRGFARGGWTGPGSKYQPAGVVHADEFVVRKESQQQMRSRFPGLLDYINMHGTLPGFASGGLVEFGRKLQQKGFRVSEHPQFGGVNPVHTRNSLHYSGRAIDVNWAAGTSRIEQQMIDRIVPLAAEYGLRTIWRTTGHFNHAHFDTGRSGGLKDMIGGLFQDLKDAAGKVISEPVNWLRNTVTGLFGDIGDTKAGEMMLGFPRRALDAALNKVKELVGLVSGDKNDSVGNTSSARAAVLNAAAGYGWDTGGMWTALEWLVNKESSWNPNAKNPNSTAYGLFGFLDGTWASTGFRKSSDPDIQAAAGMAYIRERYGNPVAAKIFHQRMGWYADGGLVTDTPVAGGDAAPQVPAMMYDNGGYLPPGLTTVLNLTGKPEPVFTHSQFEAMKSGGGGLGDGDQVLFELTDADGVLIGTMTGVARVVTKDAFASAKRAKTHGRR